MKTKLAVTAPDGTIHTRTTARAYTHAVVTKSGKPDSTWGVWGFCGSFDLATKLFNQIKRYDLSPPLAGIEIVEVRDANAPAPVDAPISQVAKRSAAAKKAWETIRAKRNGVAV